MRYFIFIFVFQTFLLTPMPTKPYALLRLLAICWLFLLSACQHEPLNGRYYSQYNMLEIVKISDDKFAFQIIAGIMQRPKYVSGKAQRLDGSTFFFANQEFQLIFYFERNHINVRQEQIDAPYTDLNFYEGAYFFLNPTELHSTPIYQSSLRQPETLNATCYSGR